MRESDNVRVEGRIQGNEGMMKEGSKKGMREKGKKERERRRCEDERDRKKKKRTTT